MEGGRQRAPGAAAVQVQEGPIVEREPRAGIVRIRFRDPIVVFPAVRPRPVGAAAARPNGAQGGQGGQGEAQIEAAAAGARAAAAQPQPQQPNNNNNNNNNRRLRPVPPRHGQHPRHHQHQHPRRRAPEVRRYEDTMAGATVRRVMDTYCPYCATDIRSAGPRRIMRCPNRTLCGKRFQFNEGDNSCCPNCTHYTRPNDNFCRICRTNLRGLVRVPAGRGSGLFQQLMRVPSPIHSVSPPREEIPAPQPRSIDMDEEEHEQLEVNGELFDVQVEDEAFGSDEDDEDEEPNVNNRPPGVGRIGGFLRIIDMEPE